MSIILQNMFENFSTNYYDNTHMNYNLIEESENNITLELDVSGISESDIELELLKNILKVSAKNQDNRKYLYNGFRKKTLEHKFQLSKNIEVKGASVKNGVLSVRLEYKIPEEEKPKKILIEH